MEFLKSGRGYGQPETTAADRRGWLRETVPRTFPAGRFIALFVTQGFDGVKLSGGAGWIEPENHANTDRNSKRQWQA